MKILRIRPTFEGYVCEIKKGFLFKKWIPFITFKGSNTIFPYSNLERVLNDLPNYLHKNEEIKLEINLTKK